MESLLDLNMKVAPLFFLFCSLICNRGKCSSPDSLYAFQQLYNGRAWKNDNPSLAGDPFLYTNAYLKGSVTIHGHTFDPVRLKYDLWRDEIVTPMITGEPLQLNKEGIDSFTLLFDNRIVHFRPLMHGQVKELEGYVEILYEGKSALYMRHTKKVDRSAVENKKDTYFQQRQLYYVMGGEAFPVSGRRDFFRILGDRRVQAKEYMHKNHVKVSSKRPESFAAVARYIDSLK